jgi:hypothetical protein
LLVPAGLLGTVRDRDVLNRGPPGRSLRVEAHELVDFLRDGVGDRQTERSRFFGAYRVVVRPATARQRRGELLRLLVGHAVTGQDLYHGRTHLLERLAADVGEDEGLVVDLRDGLLLDDVED